MDAMLAPKTAEAISAVAYRAANKPRSQAGVFSLRNQKMAYSHSSDCLIYNAPDLPAGECDCGGLELCDEEHHGLVTALISGAGSSGIVAEDGEGNGFIQPGQPPADRFIAGASAAAE
jgi:hypothetical protein